MWILGEFILLLILLRSIQKDVINYDYDRSLSIEHR